MCGTLPVDHWPRNRLSISSVARRLSTCARPSAMNAESQLHWCGYREGAGLVQAFSPLRRNTSVASGFTPSKRRRVSAVSGRLPSRSSSRTSRYSNPRPMAYPLNVYNDRLAFKAGQAPRSVLAIVQPRDLLLVDIKRLEEAIV